MGVASLATLTLGGAVTFLKGSIGGLVAMMDSFIGVFAAAIAVFVGFEIFSVISKGGDESATSLSKAAEVARKYGFELEELQDKTKILQLTPQTALKIEALRAVRKATEGPVLAQLGLDEKGRKELEEITKKYGITLEQWNAAIDKGGKVESLYKHLLGQGKSMKDIIDRLLDAEGDLDIVAESSAKSIGNLKESIVKMAIEMAPATLKISNLTSLLEGMVEKGQLLQEQSDKLFIEMSRILDPVNTELEDMVSNFDMIIAGMSEARIEARNWGRENPLATVFDVLLFEAVLKSEKMIADARGEAAKKQNEIKTTEEKTLKTVKDLVQEHGDLLNGLSSIDIIMRDIMESGVAIDMPMPMFRKMLEEMDDVRELKSFKDQLEQNVSTPLEKIWMDFLKIKELFKDPFFDEETGVRGIEKLIEKTKELEFKREFAVTGRVGFDEFANRIQDALLTNDPEKKAGAQRDKLIKQGEKANTVREEMNKTLKEERGVFT